MNRANDRTLFLVFFLVLLVASNANARVRLSPELDRVERSKKISKIEKDAQQTFLRYLSCQRFKDLKKIRGIEQFLECTTQYLSTKLPEIIKKELSIWVHNDIEISPPAPCSAEEETYFSILPKKPDALLCFSFVSERLSKTGYVFFQKQGGQLRISGIKF